jgi:hypothetical protein
MAFAGDDYDSAYRMRTHMMVTIFPKLCILSCLFELCVWSIFDILYLEDEFFKNYKYDDAYSD